MHSDSQDSKTNQENNIKNTLTSSPSPSRGSENKRTPHKNRSHQYGEIYLRLVTSIRSDLNARTTKARHDPIYISTQPLSPFPPHLPSRPPAAQSKQTQITTPPEGGESAAQRTRAEKKKGMMIMDSGFWWQKMKGYTSKRRMPWSN